MEFHSFYLLSPRTRSKQMLPILLFLMLTQIRLVTSELFVSSCKTADNFNEPKCFNDIIKFSDKKYRAGHTLTKKDNTVVIMFSDDSPGDSRLFYTLKENGRGFYENDEPIKVITLTDLGYFGSVKYIGRYESINEFVYLSDDTNREKQYVFSVSSYVSLTELHDIENGIYQKWKTFDFFTIEEAHYIFSYRFSLFEWKESRVYFCAFVEFEDKNDQDEDYSISYTIVRFKLDRDTSGNQISSKVVEKKIEYENNFDNRIVSAIPMEKYDCIIVFYVRNDDKKLAIKFYDYDLNSINTVIMEDNALQNPQPGYGAFLKIVHCQYEYAGLMYYTDGDDGKTLKLRFLKVNGKDDEGKFTKFEHPSYTSLNDVNFKTYILLNDFVKITPDRFLFASTAENFQKLYIYLIHNSNWYSSITIHKFNHWLPTTENNIRFNKEFAFGFYKGFTVFTSTMISIHI